ncbi:MAG TPA: luciferase family protein [Chloroflexota bacterium]|nr:luciferase family protein [Chloroflexota bacterium]
MTPTRTNPADVLLGELLAREEVEEAVGDMVGERSFRVGGREFLHVHGRAVLHIALTREQKAAALAAGEARVHPYSPRSGAVELHLRSEDQLPAARRLVQLALERAAATARRYPPAGS